MGKDLTTADLPVSWSRSPGLELLGLVPDSGLSARTFLVRRADGQVVQVSELLNLVLTQLDPTLPASSVASSVSDDFGRELTADGLVHLLEVRLAPLGLASLEDGGACDEGVGGEHLGETRSSRRSRRDPHPERVIPAPTARPLLSLSLRGTLIPAVWVRRIARALSPLYASLLVVAALIALVGLDIALIRSSDLLGALSQVLSAPALLVGLYLLLTAGAIWHEIGHAAACARGGGRPGTIGVGVYLLFPAFFTDVTDSYRLGRRDRLRTDLGGLYFNVLNLLLFGVLFRFTGEGVFLLALVIMHIEMLQQLVPVVRLDGYYVLSDLVGVPDLFARVGPVLRSLRPGAEQDRRVTELRPGARRVVVVWVLFVVPTLVAAMAWLTWNLPVILRQTLAALSSQVSGLIGAWHRADVALVLLGTFSVLLLAVPLLGLTVLLWRALFGAGMAVARRLDPAPSIAEPSARHNIPNEGRNNHHRRTTESRTTTSSAEESIMNNTTTVLGSSANPQTRTVGHRGEIASEPATEDPDAFLAGIWGATGTDVGVDCRAADEGSEDDADRNGAPESPPRGASTATNGRAVSPSPRSRPDDPALPVTHSAAEFRDEWMLPVRIVQPHHGWRRALVQVSAGTLNPGPSAAERRQADLEERIRTPIEGSRRVVVMSRKGGVGKTTISLALGSTFSQLRGDRTAAVDANPDAGNLAHRASVPSDRTITDVLRDLDGIDRYATLRSYTSQAPGSRLEVLASDDDPRIGMALDRNDYHHLLGLLDRFYNLILLDTGTGILDSANQGLLAEADQLIVVLRSGLDGGRAAALTLDWLEEHDYGDLVSQAVTVINAVRKHVDSPIDAMSRHFEQRCRSVVTVPWDQALETGGQTRLEDLAPGTRVRLAELAAVVADGFSATGVRK